MPDARRSPRSLVLTVSLAAHLLVGGGLSGLVCGWLVGRNRGLGSDQPAWLTRTSAAAEAVAAINAEVPPTDTVVVRCPSDVPAHDVAFYCYPRPVILDHRPPDAGPLLSPLGPGRWLVRIAEAGPPP